MRQQKWIVLVLLLVLTQAIHASPVRVDFIDVGQGDAILIRTDAGEAILIDGGTERAGAAGVVPYLEAEGITKLDLVVMTHPHEDHIGGLIPVLERIPVEMIYADGQVHTTLVYERLLLLIEKLEIPFYLARSGGNIEVGPLKLEILHPNKNFLAGLNNNSVVLRMEIDGVSFLYTGDIEKLAEEFLIEEGLLLATDILKVAHHGSQTSSSADFLAQVNPETAIIMVGEGNRYNHPDWQVLSRLEALSADIWRTDLHGTITVMVDQGEVMISGSKDNIAQEHRLNLRTVTAGELQAVPGIGPVLAERIVSYRQEIGFDTVDDLINVSGIGEKTLENIRVYFYLY